MSHQVINHIHDSFEISFNKNWRSNFLEKNLNQLKNENDLLIFFARYISFNAVFAGGVASLTGALHNSQSSFMGENQAMNRNIYSKSSEIASYIFAAAEDEFDAKRQKERITHREMARFFFDSTKEYFHDLNAYDLDSQSQKFVDEVMEGYCATNGKTDEHLFNGIGFHIASEELADQEFIEIDKFLSLNFLDLVNYLKNKKHSSGLSAYYWVQSHCSVEKDHHDFALTALLIACESYSGKLSEETLQIATSKGFETFCKLQERMIQHCVNLNENALTVERGVLTNKNITRFPCEETKILEKSVLFE